MRNLAQRRNVTPEQRALLLATLRLSRHALVDNHTERVPLDTTHTLSLTVQPKAVGGYVLLVHVLDAGSYPLLKWQSSEPATLECVQDLRADLIEVLKDQLEAKKPMTTTLYGATFPLDSPEKGMDPAVRKIYEETSRAADALRRLIDGTFPLVKAKRA